MTDQSEHAAVAYHDELTKAVLEIERLNKQYRDLDAKLLKTVVEYRTLIDHAKAIINEQHDVLEQVLTTLVALSDLDDYALDPFYFAAYGGAETIAAIKEVLK